MSFYCPSFFLVLLLIQSEEFSSALLILITLLLIWIRPILSGSGCSLQALLLFFVFLLSATFVTTSSLLMLYISFEGVLAPMFFLIMTFGYAPEKACASLYLIAYTVIGSFPFLVFTITSFGPVTDLTSLLRPALAYCLFVTFGTKTPLFWLHAWLPKAHTEAPLFGSILLSGVLLKLGRYGMFLLSPSLYLCSPLLRILCLFGAFICCLVTLRCWDSKMLVAYSSIVHMCAITSGLLVGRSCSVSASMMGMVSHSLVSPLLFWAVYVIYACQGSRCFIVLLFSSLDQSFKVLFRLLCGLNFGLPPFLGFWGELWLFSGLGYHSGILLLILFPLPFFILAYSVILLCSSIGGSTSPTMSSPYPLWLPVSSVGISLLCSTCLIGFSY